MTNFMETISITRPRDVNKWRAAAVLYGDWGTSKAYVLGLAFALAGYSSFWYILSVAILTLCVGLNYITICKFYPKGGGVYASVKDRSKVIAIIGAFFIISDYVVTAALSAVSAFHYLGAAYPEVWAITAIGVIGGLNFFGPKHTGSMAIALALPTLLVISFLVVLSLFFLPRAIHDMTPISGQLSSDWSIFVGIIVALSGIEAIANTTGSMKLDPGSTDKNPSVVKTSTPAIVMVMLEVCIYTTLLGLAMNALPGLQISDGDVNAPQYPHVRDAMLRYMGQIFGGTLLGPGAGAALDFVISIVITLLLLSAVNTAMVALISLLFVMSRDGEIPSPFQQLNRFGVPIYSTLFAFMFPIVVLLFVHDIVGLANLYAIGFVGAITVNLGSTATNTNLEIIPSKRYFMLGTAAVLALVEITLFVQKPEARNFVLAIVGIGLLLRALAIERKERILEGKKQATLATLPPPPKDLHGGLLVVTTGVNRVLDFALDEAQLRNIPLYILFIREQKVVTDTDADRLWVEDEQACKIFDYVLNKGSKNLVGFLYTVAAHPAHAIGKIAQEKQVERVIVGKQRGASLVFNMFRGTSARDIAKKMSKDIQLVIVY